MWGGKKARDAQVAKRTAWTSSSTTRTNPVTINDWRWVVGDEIKHAEDSIFWPVSHVLTSVYTDVKGDTIYANVYVRVDYGSFNRSRCEEEVESEIKRTGCPYNVVYRLILD